MIRPLFKFHIVLLTVECLLYVTLLNFSSTVSFDVNQIGENVVPSTGGFDLSAGSAVFLLNEQFPQPGVLFAFSAYFRNRNPLHFQVWRPSTPQNSKNFTLLAQLEITPSINGSQELIYIVSQLTEKCIRIETGDRLGVYFVNKTPALVYTFDAFQLKPTVLVHYQDGPASLQMTPNETTLNFDSRIFPYDFSLKAYYYLENNKVAEKSTTVDCPKTQSIEGDPKPTSPTTPVPVGMPGSTGSMGATGSAGATGLVGPTSGGYTGSPGPSGQNGQQGRIGIAGATGLPGYTGSSGEAGLSGSKGLVGATGLSGPTGPFGDIGFPGIIQYVNETDQNGTVAFQSRDRFQNERQWITESYMTGSLIWLAVLSVLIITIFIILGLLTSLYRSKQRESEDITAKMSACGMSDYNTINSRLTQPSFTNHNTIKSQRDIQEELRDMREESFANYEMDTMEKFGTKKLKDFPIED